LAKQADVSEAEIAEVRRRDAGDFDPGFEFIEVFREGIALRHVGCPNEDPYHLTCFCNGT
jgi:hypothetical protein